MRPRPISPAPLVRRRPGWRIAVPVVLVALGGAAVPLVTNTAYAAVGGCRAEVALNEAFGVDAAAGRYELSIYEGRVACHDVSAAVTTQVSLVDQTPESAGTVIGSSEPATVNGPDPDAVTSGTARLFENAPTGRQVQAVLVATMTLRRSDASWNDLGIGCPTADVPVLCSGLDTNTAVMTAATPVVPVQRYPYGATRTVPAGVALTFDDGPNPGETEQVLAVLRTYGVSATFCLLGEKAAAHPDLVRAIVADGHTLCNHSQTHDYDVGRRGVEGVRADLEATNRAILAAAPDARIGWFRNPGGEWTTRSVEVAAALGMKPLHWSTDPQDHARPGVQAIIDRVLTGTTENGARFTPAGDGSIVLLHDGGGDRSQTIAALDTIIPQLKARFPLVRP